MIQRCSLKDCCIPNEPNQILCFDFLAIYIMKQNQANQFIKKPKFMVGLTQTDRTYNSVELYCT